MNGSKQINIKTHTYYLLDGITNMKNLDRKKIRIDEKSYKNILIYYITPVTVKDLRIVYIFIPYYQ